MLHFSWIFTKMKENSLDARRVDKKKRIVSAQSSLHAAHFNSLCAKKLAPYMKFKINRKCLLHISNEPTSLINSNALVFVEHDS